MEIIIDWSRAFDKKRTMALRKASPIASISDEMLLLLLGSSLCMLIS